MTIKILFNEFLSDKIKKSNVGLYIFENNLKQ